MNVVKANLGIFDAYPLLKSLTNHIFVGLFWKKLMAIFVKTSGGRMNIACGLAQQANLNGLVVGYTITAAISMV